MSAPTGQQAPAPFGAWPTETFFGADKEIFFNNEAIQLLHQPAAHTDGDVVVFFRRSDVVAAGDVFITTGYPVDRSRARRQHPGRHRRAEPHHRRHDPEGQGRRRHLRRFPGTGGWPTKPTSSNTATW